MSIKVKHNIQSALVYVNTFKVIKIKVKFLSSIMLTLGLGISINWDRDFIGEGKLYLL